MNRRSALLLYCYLVPEVPSEINLLIALEAETLAGKALLVNADER